MVVTLTTQAHCAVPCGLRTPQFRRARRPLAWICERYNGSARRHRSGSASARRGAAVWNTEAASAGEPGRRRGTMGGGQHLLHNYCCPFHSQVSLSSVFSRRTLIYLLIKLRSYKNKQNIVIAFIWSFPPLKNQQLCSKRCAVF